MISRRIKRLQKRELETLLDSDISAIYFYILVPDQETELCLKRELQLTGCRLEDQLQEAQA